MNWPSLVWFGGVTPDCLDASKKWVSIIGKLRTWEIARKVKVPESG